MSMDSYHPIRDNEDSLSPWIPLVGGALGTAAMMLVLSAGPLVGVKTDMAQLLGQVLGAADAPPFSHLWWTGLIWQLNNGIILFPFLYAYFFEPILPGWPAPLRGMAWGAVLWLLFQAIIIPMVGGGFFSIHATYPIASILATAVAHLLYGAILGATVGTARSAATPYREELSHEPHRKAS